MKRTITNIISRLFGKFASHEFTPFVQNIINKSYVYFLRLDMSEYGDTKEYKSLNALFTRALKTPRTIMGESSDFISPCDSFISEYGKIVDGTAFQIKGYSYDVKKLLGEYVNKDDRERLISGNFINFYLSPRDYHRFHAPIDMRVTRAIHISGKLYPVNFKYLNKIPSLFCENERVILVCENDLYGKFYLVFVGALNVGKIRFIFDDKINTNAKIGSETFYNYDELYLKRGDEIGRFEMGSTIVGIFENPDIKFTKSNEKVKFAEIILKVEDE